MNRNEITYGEGPHSEIWFPWGGVNAINPPDLGDAPVRYMVLRTDGPGETNKTWSNPILSRFIPDNGGEAYWIGIPVTDTESLNKMEELTRYKLDRQKLVRLRARAKVARNAQTPQPARPNSDKPSRFIDEIAKITPSALLVTRAKNDYKDRAEHLKKIVRLTAEGGGVAVTLFLVDLPTEEVYCRAFCEVMVSADFEGFAVDARKVGDEFSTRLMLEINW